MTTTQSLKIYHILNKHFKSSEDASVVVSEIESVVDNKIDQRREILATKNDISLLKEDVLKLQNDVEKRFNNLIIWIVSTGFATLGLLLAFLKL